MLAEFAPLVAWKKGEGGGTYGRVTEAQARRRTGDSTRVPSEHLDVALLDLGARRVVVVSNALRTCCGVRA